MGEDDAQFVATSVYQFLDLSDEEVRRIEWRVDCAHKVQALRRAVLEGRENDAVQLCDEIVEHLRDG